MPRQRAKNPFIFKSTTKLVEFTGRKASTLTELLNGIKEVEGSVIFCHTLHFVLRYQFIPEEPRNDFAIWVSETLNELVLGEVLNGIDPTEFNTIRELREKIVQEIEEYLSVSGDSRSAPEGEEFHFLKTNSFIFPTKFTAYTLEDFTSALEQVGEPSIYYHIFESKLIKEQKENDFALWLREELHLPSLAGAVSRFDIFSGSLSDIRHELIGILKKYRRSSIFEKGKQLIARLSGLFRRQ